MDPQESIILSLVAGYYASRKEILPSFEKVWIIYIDDMVNPFPNKPWFLRVYSTSLLKTLGKRRNCS